MEQLSLALPSLPPRQCHIPGRVWPEPGCTLLCGEEPKQNSHLPFHYFILAHAPFPHSHTTISQPTTLTLSSGRKTPSSLNPGHHNGMAPSALAYSLLCLAPDLQLDCSSSCPLYVLTALHVPSQDTAIEVQDAICANATCGATCGALDGCGWSTPEGRCIQNEVTTDVRHFYQPSSTPRPPFPRSTTRRRPIRWTVNS